MKRECQKKGTDKNRTLFSVVKSSEREKEKEREREWRCKFAGTATKNSAEEREEGGSCAEVIHN